MHSKIFSGKYHVQREIARGGMGTVYLAVDQTLHREVAIKLPHQHLNSDPKFIRKFLKEAQRMAQMNHENVIRIYEIEEDAGVHFIVMEYFPGKDLKQLLHDKGPLELSLALKIAISVTQGLAYAHKQDLIHRDIKPGNVLLDDQYNVKIVDFGIAAALGESSSTMTSTILGTPEYMSPEQVQGGHLTPSSDLYSLGMVLYEMVSGTTPFKGIPYQTIIIRLADESFEPAYDFPVHVPSSLQFLIRGLTQKSLHERIQDTAVVLETLRGYQHQPAFLAASCETIDPSVTESDETVVLDASSSSPQKSPRKSQSELEQPGQRPSFSPQPSAVSSPKPSDFSRSSIGDGKSPQEQMAPVEAPSRDQTQTIRLGHERQPLSVSSWMVLSFAIIMIVGVSGYLWYRTSFDVPVSQEVAEDHAPTLKVVDEKAKEVIERMVAHQSNIREIDAQITSHTKKFETDAQRLFAQLQSWKQKAIVSGGQSLLPGQRRSQEVISQNWHVLVDERMSEFLELKERMNRVSSNVDNTLQESRSLLQGPLPPSVRDMLERTRNQLLVAQQGLSTHMTYVAKQWQEHDSRMDKALALPRGLSTSVEDFDVILSNFREAYQRKDLTQLEDITNMSQSRARMLRGLFRYWTSFDVKVDVRSKTSQEATVVVTLENMIDRTGRPISRKQEGIIGTQKLTIHKQGEGWGKLEW